jgi:hypothetical protein
MSSIQHYYNDVDPETLALLESTLDETWKAVRNNGTFDEVATRTAIADLTMQFAAEGERDPQRLKALVLAALPYYA